MAERPASDRPATAGPKVQDVLEVEIEKLVAGGDGLARCDGLPVFVGRAAPGDRLRVRIWQRKPDYARAEILEVLAPGPGRREPPCPHFERCGGCDLQHLDEEHQLRYKVAAARETLERLGGVDWPAAARVIAGEQWGYRLRAGLRLEPPGAGESAARIGYLERNSHRLVAVERCPVLLPELESALAELRGTLSVEAPRRLDLAVGGDGRVTGSPVLAGVGRGAVEQRVGEFDYRFDARCFFQAHRGLLDRLVEVTVGEWRGERAYDLFAGVGLFALPLARRYRQVIAVEGDAIAARFQRGNARQLAGGGLTVVGQAVETWAEGLPKRADRVVVDPPRPGLPRRLRALLLARRPRRLTYVSCHPAALARDLRALLGEGYALEELTLLDLFPQTGHLEIVTQLVSG